MTINQGYSDSQILERLYGMIHKIVSPEKKQSGTNFTKQIFSYVEQHLSDSNITLKEIAENQLFMNVDYVSKRFLKETGRKFSDYLAEVRIRKAKQYLAEGWQIQQVAEKVGCGNNPHYFSQLFKKKTGMTPSALHQQSAAQVGSPSAFWAALAASSTMAFRFSSRGSPFSIS